MLIITVSGETLEIVNLDFRNRILNNVLKDSPVVSHELWYLTAIVPFGAMSWDCSEYEKDRWLSSAVLQ